MAKITFMGRPATAFFAKNILGDAMLADSLHDAHIALYDIDPRRLDDSKILLEVLNRNIEQGRGQNHYPSLSR